MNANQPDLTRDPLLGDRTHGAEILEVRKQHAFVGYTFKGPRREVYDPRRGMILKPFFMKADDDEEEEEDEEEVVVEDRNMDLDSSLSKQDQEMDGCGLESDLLVSDECLGLKVRSMSL